MKKITILCFAASVIAVSANQVQAQEWNYQYGLQAGANLPGYKLSAISSGISREVSAIYGFLLGGTFEASPGRYFALQTGLSVQLLGAQLNRSEYGSTEVLQQVAWLQIPLNLVGKIPLADSSHFFLSAGVYGATGLFGKNWIPNSYAGSTSNQFSFGDDGTQKNIDYGLNFHVGYRLSSGYSLSVGYLKGLQNIAPSEAKYEQRNQAWQLTLGYTF